MLRTNTGNTGTVRDVGTIYCIVLVVQEYYRAPEVHCHSGYDPGYADIWSIGMTLFFFVRDYNYHVISYYSLLV